ncbi:MAG: phosphoesterase [Aquificae bacterium]|nr:phosphoesterase [Aquificota bacterium]
MEKIICIYHKNCTDGTTAAAVLLKKFPDCMLVPLEHNYSQEDIEAILSNVDKNTTVYIVDFSLKKEDLENLLKKARKVVLIDHHIGVKSLLESLAKKYKNFEYIFDNNRSGASLAWIYLFKGEEIPPLIKFVEDKDIWTWKYGEKTKYANAYLFLFTNKPEKVVELLDQPIEKILEKGKILSEYTDYIVNYFIEKAKETYLKIGNYKVKAFNTGLFQSEIGNLMCQKYKEPIALFNISGDIVKFSFRSCDFVSPSALELAKILGGGGHKNAAGAVVPLKDFCDMILFN